MSQLKSKKTLINWDLVSVNPNDKNWDWKDLFFLWGANIQSVIGFSLITSLYVLYDLNTFVVFVGTLLATFLVYFFSFSLFYISGKNVGYLLLSKSNFPEFGL